MASASPVPSTAALVMRSPSSRIDASANRAVIDVVLETEDAFEMYSYTGGRWMDYGTQRKDDEEAPSMTGTLASYRLLAGETTLALE